MTIPSAIPRDSFPINLDQIDLGRDSLCCRSAMTKPLYRAAAVEDAVEKLFSSAGGMGKKKNIGKMFSYFRIVYPFPGSWRNPLFDIPAA